MVIGKMVDGAARRVRLMSENANESRQSAIFARQAASASYNFRSMLQIVFFLGAYFVLVIAALALFTMPHFRGAAASKLKHGIAWGGGRMRMAGQSTQSRFSTSVCKMADAIRLAAQLALACWQKVLIVLLLVTFLPLGALAWRHWFQLETFDHTDVHIQDARVAALLAGEKLTPPAPLPPAVFLTREVTSAIPLARFASRDWMLLDEVFRQRVLTLYRVMQEQHGYEMVLLEGYRSPERQAQLAALGTQVTQAGPGRSYHQHGLAVDSAFLRNGRVVISEQDPWAMRGYRLYGQTAALLGLTWGGNWKGLADYGHIELQRPGVLRSSGG
jgi:peptidoglycan L-alanyl-D-glutamate endopeptidase CwlK